MGGCPARQACLAEREQDIQQLGQIITAVQRGDIQLEHLQQLDLSGGLYSDRDDRKAKSAADRARDEQPAKFTALPTEEVTWEVRVRVTHAVRFLRPPHRPGPDSS